MPKVGNKTFPYTAKGIDDAKKEKKRIAVGKAMPRKASPKRKYDPQDPTVYLTPNRVAPRKRVPKTMQDLTPYKMPRMRPAVAKLQDPTNYLLPRPVKPVKMPTVPRKRPETLARIKPAKRRPVKTSPMKKVK